MLRITVSQLTVWFLICVVLDTNQSYAVTTPETEPVREVIYLAYDEPRSWDPSIAVTNERDLHPNIYEPLVRYQLDGDSYRLEPVLAVAWEQSEDGLQWTFQLRQNVSFHDGEKFNALAVKTSIERTLQLARGAAFIWWGVTAIEVISEYEVKFITAKPMSIDLIAAAQYGAYIYSPKAARLGTEWFNRGNTAGTGPYVVSYWKRDHQIILEQNSDYWAGWPRDNHVEKVKYRIVRNGATQCQMMLAGKAHFITAYAYETLAVIAKSPGINIQQGQRMMNLNLVMNTQKYPTDNLKFRKALQHAMDYEGVAKHIYNNYVTLSRGPIPGALWGADRTIQPPSFDMELAKRYLRESGVPVQDWQLTMSYTSTNVQYGLVARVFQQNLAKIGVTLKLLPGPWNATADLARKLDSAPNLIPMMWWPTYVSPSDFLIGLYRTEKLPLFNLAYYANPEFDALVDAGRDLEAIDRELAITKYQQAQRIIMRDAVAIHFGDFVGRRTYSAEIEGVQDINPAYSETVFFHQVGVKLR